MHTLSKMIVIKTNWRTMLEGWNVNGKKYDGNNVNNIKKSFSAALWIYWNIGAALVFEAGRSRANAAEPLDSWQITASNSHGSSHQIGRKKNIYILECGNGYPYSKFTNESKRAKEFLPNAPIKNLFPRNFRSKTTRLGSTRFHTLTHTAAIRRQYHHHATNKKICILFTGEWIEWFNNG